MYPEIEVGDHICGIGARDVSRLPVEDVTALLKQLPLFSEVEILLVKPKTSEIKQKVKCFLFCSFLSRTNLKELLGYMN